MPKPIYGKRTDIYQKPGTTSYTALSNRGNGSTAIHRLNTNPNFNPMVNAAKAAELNRQKAKTAPKPGAGGGYTGGGYTGGGFGGGSAAASYSAPAQSSNYMNSYISQMQSAMQAAQQAAAEAQSRAEEQMRAAQEAQRRAREEAYQRSAAQQKANYEYGQGELNRATDNALQQAYINKMMSERNFAQQLAAQGLNGGASETTTAGMLNNYNNSRNALETERQNQLASLENTYQNNMAQLENQRASGDAADLSQYQTNLASLTANNTNNLVSLMQGYANMAASMPQLRQRFNTTTGQWEYSYE
nr:MAG TPA: Transcription initiation factor TFIID subunit, DNA, Nuclear [Caudoviricetes sp.]